MESKAIGVLAVEAPVLDGDTTCAVVQQVFREHGQLSGLLLRRGHEVALVDRAGFDVATATATTRALRRQHAWEVADRAPLRLPHDLDLLDAAGHVLARTGPSLYEDVVIDGPGDEQRVVPVSRMLAELTRLYRHQARHDVLTGLANRALVLEQLTALQARARRHGGLVAVMFVDLDGFKWVNDTHGHRTGDQLLVHVAQRLRDAARQEDVVGRLGGDEFVVIAAVDGVDALPGLGSRILDALDSPFPIEGGPAIRIRASVGIAADDDGRPADELLQLADDAMYAAKRTVGSRVAFANQVPGVVLATTGEEDRRLAERLDAAITDDRLRLAYQPLVDLQTGTIERVEVLARLPLPDGELVPPDRFVAVAEQSELTHRLGHWVLRTALAQLADWDARLGSDAPSGIAVNVSARQCADSRFVSRLADIVAAAGVPPSRLWLEVAESVVAQGDPGRVRTLHQLADLGFHVSIDDFGVGDVSLTRIAQLPVDELKIDRSLVSGFGTEWAQRQVVRMIVGMGRELGVNVVAEGVETDEQVRLLRLLDCPMAQGYHFARPMWDDALARRMLEVR